MFRRDVDNLGDAVTRAVPRRLFILVSSLVLIEVMFYSVLSPLLPYYVRHLHESKAAAGVLTASYAIGALVSAIPAGLIVGRVGARRGAVSGMFLLGATCLAFGFADSIYALDAARFVQGVASSFIWTGGLTWLVVESSSERRGEVVGSVLGIAIAGSALGPVVGAIAELAGPKLAFSCLAAAIITLALVALAAPQPPVGERHPARELLRAVGRDRRMLAGMWFTTLGALMFGVLSVLGPLQLSALGAGTLGIAATFFVSSVLEAIASPVIGRASDRRGPMPVVRLSLASASLAALLLPLPQTLWLFAARDTRRRALLRRRLGAGQLAALQRRRGPRDRPEHPVCALEHGLGGGPDRRRGARGSDRTGDERCRPVRAPVCALRLRRSRDHASTLADQRGGMNGADQPRELRPPSGRILVLDPRARGSSRSRAMRRTAAARAPTAGCGAAPMAASRGRCRAPARDRRASARRCSSRRRRGPRSRRPSRGGSAGRRLTLIDQSRGTASGPPQWWVIAAFAAAGKWLRTVLTSRAVTTAERSLRSLIGSRSLYGAPRPPIAIRPSVVRWA